MSYTKLIAETIKKADTTYFFEDYTKQAKAVLRILHKNGLTIVPQKPTDKMIKAGVLAVSTGSIEAKELAKTVFISMIEADEK